MVWKHKGRMHWTSDDIAGVICEVKIVDGISHCKVISEKTGEILLDEQHSHPIAAMNAAGSYRPKEVSDAV